MISRTALISFFLNRRWFWQFKHSFTRNFFYSARTAYQLKHWAAEEIDKFNSLKSIFWNSAKSLLFALACSILIHVVEKHFRLRMFPLASSTTTQDSYVSFLATVAGIGGVFIGLYYTALSTVGSSAFSKAPNKLRNLLTRERVGNVYMQFLSFLTFFCLCLIGFSLFGQPVNFSAIILTIILAGLGIIAFAKLGQRAFFFFDPTTLSSVLFGDLRNSIGGVQVNGFQWQSASFQNHSRIQAKNAISTLTSLTEYVQSDKNLVGESFFELTKSSFYFLNEYVRSKPTIPSNSRWYAQKPVHKNWYLTNETALRVASITATTLDPDIISNKNWVEDIIEPKVISCFQENIRIGNWSISRNLLLYFNMYAKTLAQNGDCPKALAIADQLMNVLAAHLQEEKGLGELKNQIEYLSIIEIVCLLPINIFLSYTERLKGFGKSEINTRLAQANWSRLDSVYKKGFNLHLIPRIEWIQTRIEFEIQTEGRQVSPLWFISELVCQTEAESFALNRNEVIFEMNKKFNSWKDLLYDIRYPAICAALYSRELEYWFKVTHQMDVYSEKWEELCESKLIEGLSWPDKFEEKILECVEQKRNSLFQDIAKRNIVLSLKKIGKEFPDYPGQFLHMTADASIKLIVEKNPTTFDSLFAPLLIGTFFKFDELRSMSNDDGYKSSNGFKIASAPILDLLEISGLAIIMSEYLGQPEFMSIISKHWDRYLSETKDMERQLKLIAGAVWISEADFELPHRSVLRTGWRQRIYGELKTIPRRNVGGRRGRAFVQDDVVDHPSPLIRLIARERYGASIDGIDVFIAFFISIKGDSVKLDFGKKRRSILERIEREKAYFEKLTSEG